MSNKERDTFKKQLYGRIVSARTIEPASYPELATVVKAIKI
jgi:hypothetical protein